LNKKFLINKLELNNSTTKKLTERGYKEINDLEGVSFSELYEFLSFDQVKSTVKELLKFGIRIKTKDPDWSEVEWEKFISDIVQNGFVSWKEVALAICGELNPPQVGTAIASNKSFQAKYPPRKTMQKVMEWFYDQDGVCENCGTRLFLEADHVIPKEDYIKEGKDPEEADRLENLQLLCKRCNVIKRPSHALGGLTFASAQSVLIWILLTKRPTTKSDYYTLCRNYGLTMANIRFDETWAFAEWLSKSGKYNIS
jgi:hypothetical protein